MIELCVFAMAYAWVDVICMVLAKNETYELLVEGEIMRNKYVAFQWAWNPINPSVGIPDEKKTVYQVVPGAGWSFVDFTLWMWPTKGATCTAPRFDATYLL